MPESQKRRKSQSRGRSGGWRTRLSLALIAGATPLLLGAGPDTALGQYVVFAQNDLGMHCMQRDYTHLMILPPYNNVNAWIYRRGESPQPVTQLSGRSLSIYVPGNTRSSDKTNWWRYSNDILGAAFPPDVGLTGNGLFGDFTYAGNRRFEITGIPITPLDDAGRNNPYPLAMVEFKDSAGAVLASAQPVLPVSWELRCDLCHGDPEPGQNAEVDMLRDHDRLHGTDLEANQPVFCASCHGDPALGAAGQPGVSMFSHAMHGAHADRLADLPITLTNECYACHPGERAQCQRDVHEMNNVRCNDCHGAMADVGNPSRTPWVDEPRCADCHTRSGFEFEPAGVLFRNAQGHGGVACVVCHGSPHAITPSVSEADNLQHMALQGTPGTLNTCSVCHIQQPGDPFPHRRDD